MTPKLALIVDDEADIRELVEITLNRMGIETLAAADLGEAYHLLASHSFDLCLSDMRLPDGEGTELVEHISQNHPNTPVAVITAHANAENAVESLKCGAFDYVSKPVDIKLLRRLVDAAIKSRAPQAKPQSGPEQPQLIGDSAPIAKLKQTIDKLSRSQAPVHIQGESGTGKELVAKLIHAGGSRADQPFIPVNCGAIPAELMESEFFGHRKGSFTGAISDKPGMFQAAHGGTLFLDEVADLPLAMQVKLLRAIQERAIRAVGAESEQTVDVRIVSATHKDLAQEVKAQRFRHDLYYRLNVIQVNVPPLRQRTEDIPQLAAYLLQKLNQQMQLDPTPSLSKAAKKALSSYPFPGNVRELENILERALALLEGDTIQADDLDLSRIDLESTEIASSTNPFTPNSQANTGLEEKIEDIQRREIEDALEQTRYNKTEAAKLLGLTFRQLRYRIKKLGLE